MKILTELIDDEREIRRQLARDGKPVHHWRLRREKYPPIEEFWCDHCQAYYGVPHERAHNGGLCRWVGRALQGERQCACIDCMMGEYLHRLRSERSPNGDTYRRHP